MSDIKYTAILPQGWARARGYSHAVRAEGRQIVRISGQVATKNGAPKVDAALDFGQQWDLALSNVVALAREAGGAPEHITSLRAYVTTLQEFHAAGKAVGEAWMKHMGKHFPAMTLVQVSGLVDPDAKVEIEAEAVLP